ncbi:hypothetical protein CEXT_628871 [Caerostris extrusa]|uniref:Uncharacterized protein n=1 Tax=Caerostris extrusa TaxID=172846 RepID=A0AAV4PDD9_CAEEX|nr:hypothetical protein CEXT_628871 [Caerostris extrusa]
MVQASQRKQPQSPDRKGKIRALFSSAYRLFGMGVFDDSTISVKFPSDCRNLAKWSSTLYCGNPEIACPQKATNRMQIESVTEDVDRRKHRKQVIGRGCAPVYQRRHLPTKIGFYLFPGGNDSSIRRRIEISP